MQEAKEVYNLEEIEEKRKTRETKYFSNRSDLIQNDEHPSLMSTLRMALGKGSDRKGGTTRR